MHSILCRCLLVLLAFPLSAQVRPSPILRLPPSLQQVTQRAGTIFAGMVSSITPIRATASDQIASIQITFQVEQAIRGVRIGQTLTIREWAGLWTASDRYHVGQRLMLFLYAPSKMGFTSPVGGSAGRFLVDKAGRIQLTPPQAQVTRLLPALSRPQFTGRIPLGDFTRAVRRMAQE